MKKHKYVYRCHWRWLPRRIHLSIHHGRLVSRDMARVVAPSCTTTQADLDWLASVAANLPEKEPS